mmetsp:Transcript_120698/g.336113  ORF Transcript_120698/g.336113 Transcript_120698/m.336113 type:complete len:292 (+) Transcript_120698:82-957(+)
MQLATAVLLVAAAASSATGGAAARSQTVAEPRELQQKVEELARRVDELEMEKMATEERLTREVAEVQRLRAALEDERAAEPLERKSRAPSWATLLWERLVGKAAAAGKDADARAGPGVESQTLAKRAARAEAETAEAWAWALRSGVFTSALSCEEDPEFRELAARGIGRAAGNAKIPEGIVRGLARSMHYGGRDEESVRARRVAAWAIGRVAERDVISVEVLQALARASNDSSVLVRAAVADAIGSASVMTELPRDAIRAWAHLMADDDAVVHRVARGKLPKDIARSAGLL